MLKISTFRIVLFLVGCIGSRLVFTALSAFSSNRFLKLLGLIALIPVVGWLYIIFISKRDTGFEVFGGKIWWQNLRPVHLLLWLLFACLALYGNRNAWLVLLFDTLFGLGSFLVHYNSYYL